VVLTDTVYVTSQYPATLITDADGTSALITNTSSSVTCYIGDTNAIEAGDLTRTVALAPGGAMNVDGSAAKYGICPAGQVAPLAVILGAISFNPGTLTIQGNVQATVAGTVDVSGSTVDLAGGTTIDVAGNVDVVGSGGFFPTGNTSTIAQQGTYSGATAFTVAAGATHNIVSLVDVSNFSTYEISIEAYDTNQGVTGHDLTIPVTFSWYDDTNSGIPVYVEEWDIWIGNTAGSVNPGSGAAFGCGPMHGHYMTVSVSEVGGVGGYTVQFVNIYGSNRVLTRSNWRQAPPQMSSSGITFGAVIAGAENYTINNILFSMSNASIANGSLLWFPCGLYSGFVWWAYQPQQALGNDICLCVADPRLLQSGGIVAGSAATAILTNDPVTAGTQTQKQLMLPRCPVYFVVRNNTGSAASLSATLVAQEVA
jgi:hypothetical protein